MENTKPAPITKGPQDGENLSVVGDTYRILVNGKETGGTFAAIDMLISCGLRWNGSLARSRCILLYITISAGGPQRPRSPRDENRLDDINGFDIS